MKLRGYSDKDECKSTSGCAFTLASGAISWCSKKQICIGSMLEAECVTYSASVQEAVWLKRFLHSVSFLPQGNESMLVYCDSTSALAYAEDPENHGKSKHIDIRHPYIRDMVA